MQVRLSGKLTASLRGECKYEYVCLYNGSWLCLNFSCYLMHAETLYVMRTSEGWTELEKYNILSMQTCFFSSPPVVLSLCSGSAGASSFCQAHRLWIRDPSWEADHCPSTEGNTRSHFPTVFCFLSWLSCNWECSPRM